MVADPFNLQRFVEAQSGSYDAALGELRAGRKRSHWIWWVFPQIEGLGRSGNARLYALSGPEEARAYLAHPLLGPRYREAVEALMALPPTTAEAVLGDVDAMKLRSSLTLFQAASGEPLFTAALARWYGGERDAATLDRLEAR